MNWPGLFRSVSASALLLLPPRHCPYTLAAANCSAGKPLEPTAFSEIAIPRESIQEIMIVYEVVHIYIYIYICKVDGEPLFPNILQVGNLLQYCFSTPAATSMPLPFPALVLDNNAIHSCPTRCHRNLHSFPLPTKSSLLAIQIKSCLESLKLYFIAYICPQPTHFLWLPHQCWICVCACYTA